MYREAQGWILKHLETFRNILNKQLENSTPAKAKALPGCGDLQGRGSTAQATTSTERYREIPRDTRRYLRDSERYREIPRDTERYQEIPRDTERYREIPGDTESSEI